MTLPPQVLDAFDELASAQRGIPEDAMVAAQFAMGGGVLSVAIEHTGDLTHRMAARDHVLRLEAGYDMVGDKVDKVLKLMRASPRRMPFVDEYRQNITNNARFHGVPLPTYQGKVDVALSAYARAHKKLKVYNAMQRFARDAAVALGEQRFGRAIEFLEFLEWNLETPEKWVKRATEFELTSQGLVKTV